MRTRCVAVVAVALVANVSGCSALFVDGPPPNHAKLRYFDCDSSRLAPVVDGSIAGIMGLAVLGASDSGIGEQETGPFVMTIAIAGAALASSVYGWSKTSACQEAKTALSARMLDRSSYDDDLPSRAAPAVDPWLSPGPPPGVPRGRAAPSESWR
jgi:hypothetical protein